MSCIFLSEFFQSYVERKVKVIYGLSKNKAASEVLANSPELIISTCSLMPNDSVSVYAISSLHNLIRHHQDVKEAIRCTDGISQMIMLLKTKDQPKFLTIVIDCLYNLAFNNQEIKVCFFVFDLKTLKWKFMLRCLDDYFTTRWTGRTGTQKQNKISIIVAGKLYGKIEKLKNWCDLMYKYCRGIASFGPIFETRIATFGDYDFIDDT